MNRFPDAGSPLFRYLLRELTTEEEAEIESRLLIDNEYMEELNAAEDELIDAYVWGRLTEEKRERFERYFLCSEERRKKLRLAQALYESVERAHAMVSTNESWFSRSRRWLSSRIYVSVPVYDIDLSVPVYQALAALLIIGLGVVLWMFLYPRLAVTRGLDALYAAYAQERPIEARVTGFNYAKYVMSHNGEAVKFDILKQRIAGNILHEEAYEKKSPAAYHALGKFYLTEMRFNEAIDFFVWALKSSSMDAKLHNDLAAALMARERAKRADQAAGEGYAEALEYLHRAIELDGSLLDAHFNLALCHQYQMLWRTAGEDWQRYLGKDSQSPWAEEARKNLARIEEQIKKVGEMRRQLLQDFQEAYRGRDGERLWRAYNSSRLSTGSFITEGLIDDYLSSKLSGRPAEAGDKLQALLFVGEIEVERIGDRYNYDLAQFYRLASLPQLQKLSEARGMVKSAHELFGRSRLDEAIGLYLRARELFDRTRDAAESLAARRRLGHCYFRQANTKLALSVLTSGLRESEARNYTWLLSMFHNDLNNVHIRLTTYSRALDHARSLLACAKQIEDSQGILRGLNRVMNTYLLLARHRDSLPIIREGLSLASEMRPDLNQIVELYAGASVSYIALGRFMAALDYQKEALKLGLEINNPWLTSRYYTRLGLIYSKLGNRDEAIRLIRSGEEIGKRLNNRLGREIIVYSQLHLGQVYRESGDLDSSARSYQAVLRLCDENDIDIPERYYSAKRGVLLTHIRQRDDAATEAELNQVIDWYEQQRDNIEDEHSRNSFFDNEQGIYDIAIGFAFFKRRNDRRAFDYSEMSRARSLLDTINLPAEKLPEGDLTGVHLPYSIQPMNLDQIQGRLPDKVCLLQYAVLDDRLIIWAVSRNDIKSRSVEIGHLELNDKVTAYLKLLAGGLNDARADHRALSSELYDLLIRPVELLPARDEEICIIPDKILNRLPFASLISPSTGRYLIEERAIFTSPSANMFLVATEKARQKESVKVERLLSVGNPSFDRGAFHNLKDLPWATDQAEKIATFYRAPVVLLEQDARESAIRRELERSDVAHFAMHYVADERTPLLSLLPLAEERAPAPKERDGILQTQDFYRMNLSRLRMVVLSACQTGIEEYYNGEGAMSLARAFEATGIPLVVASLWPVESYPTKELMISFHRHRKLDRLPTVEALRQAQLDMIKSADPELRNPYHWAVYTVIGGHANF